MVWLVDMLIGMVQFIDLMMHQPIVKKIGVTHFLNDGFGLIVIVSIMKKNLALTAAGGTRKLLWWSEEVAIIGIHYQGYFYEFSSTNSKIKSEIKLWGKWKIEAYNERFKVKILGITNLNSTHVRVPTAKGLLFACRDTLKGELSLELKHNDDQTIVRANSNVCGLEIGGDF